MWKLNIEIFLPVDDIFDYRLRIGATFEALTSGTAGFFRYTLGRDPVSIEPWVLLRTTNHGLSTGDSVIISGSTNTDDLPDGTYEVTVIDEYEFHIYYPRVYPYTPRDLSDQRGICTWAKVGFEVPAEYQTGKIFLWQKDDTRPESAPVDVEYFTNVCSIADLTLRPEDTAAAPDDTLYRKDYLDMVFRSKDLMLEMFEIIKADISGLKSAIEDVVSVEEDGEFTAGDPVDWTPAEIDTEQWQDASDADTIVDVGGYVAQWDDLSGNDNYLMNNSGSTQPRTGVRTINGKNVISFEGGMYLLSQLPAALAMLNDNFQVYIVSVTDDTAKEQRVFHAAEFSDDENIAVYFGINNNVSEYYYGISASLKIEGTTAIDTDPHIDYIKSVRPSNIIEFRKDSNLINNGASPGSQLQISRLTIGDAVWPSGLKTLEGAIAEIVIIEGDDQTDRDKIEGYLAWKWGIQGNLPVGHPFKDEKPTSLNT